MKFLIALVMFLALAGCSQTGAEKRDICIRNCADWSCDTDHQPQVCQSCLANCSTFEGDR
jgi:hypothetical protein